MQQIDRLLNQYGNIKQQYDNYSTELESIRAEIQGVIELSPDNSYQNND